ncbi:MAG: FAD binding domain-containing protein [Pyrinomonadaceae bacterium]
MRPFQYVRATDEHAAVQAASALQAKYLAGGTNLIDLMKEDVERPSTLVDITRLPLNNIQATAKGVTIGALAHNTETANHAIIRQHYPLLTQAILAGATAQLRNMATNGGNLNQRTRCQYFYEVGMPCNKREPGTGCSAIGGINRYHAIFGWSDKCIAVNPSDMCIALAALDAVVHVTGPNGERTIPFADYHRLPGETPEKDNNLAPGELVTSIEISKNNFAANSYYLKVRDRASYAFALVSVAAALDMKGKRIQTARIAMGGVAHKPWRALEAEKMLLGKDATEANFRAAAEAEMANAKPHEYNKFKVELGRRAIIRALTRAANGGAA